MEALEVIEIGREALWVLIIMAAPVMIISMIVGITISLFQALTQIQEMTLTFVPKILAIFITIIITMPFMLATISDFYMEMMEKVALQEPHEESPAEGQ